MHLQFSIKNKERCLFVFKIIMISVMSDTNIRAVRWPKRLKILQQSYNSKEITISPADLVNFIEIKIIIFSHI